MGAGDNSGYVISPRYWVWLGHRRTIAVLLGIAALVTGGYHLWHAWHWFDNPPDIPEEHRRADGNAGHAQIDFGGQWVMGRMLVLGYGRELYHRQRQWEVVRAGFPVEDEHRSAREESILPKAQRWLAPIKDTLDHDTNHMMGWFMGTDDPAWKTVGGATAASVCVPPFGNTLFTLALEAAAAETVTPAVVADVTKPAIGGPLYPPVHALLYAPIGAINRPQTAYHVIQIVGVLMVFVTGFAVQVLSRGRIPWSLAAIAIFLFPGTRGGLDLGQNPTVSLAIVLWGWALVSRGYSFAGGLVWGLFAFKPVWGLAFFLVPLLTRRWRFAAGIAVGGLSLVAATIPFVGVQAWLDWLQVGKEAAALYNVNNNWIHLSRDLQGIPRRILHNFSLPEAERDAPQTKAIAWALWGGVLFVTVFVYLRFADRKRATGVGIASLFFGAYLTCYRFMYYDALLIAAGCAVLFAEPARFFRTRVFRLSPGEQPQLRTGRELPAVATDRGFLGPQLLGYVCSFPVTIFALLLLYEISFSGLDLKATLGIGYFSRFTTASDGATGSAAPRVEFDSGVNYPWETFLAIALWTWCAVRLIRGDERGDRSANGAT